LAIYRKAGRLQRDGRFRPTGRANHVLHLDDAIYDLCLPLGELALPLEAGPANNDRLLVSEVMRLMLDEQRFLFVTAEPAAQSHGTSQPVSGTNNEAERTRRGAAAARKTGRTSKTVVGARRQTIVVSVLESLRLYLPAFTRTSVVAEIERWWQTGQSCFTKLLKQMELPQRPQTILDKALPIPDG
jgi:transposase